MIMNKTLGIIGFGRFGQLIAKHLKYHLLVYVSDCLDKSKIAKEIGVVFTSVEECAKKDIVILCVPISKFESVLNQIIPQLKRNATVLDVCSVKEKPCKFMNEYVSKSNCCIGAHPLFGPDTAKNGLKDKKIVLCPISSTQKISKITNFLNQIGLDVIITDPQNHDIEMAKSLALIHFLGRGLNKINVQDVKLATPTHEMFVELVNIVKNDSEQLFKDMQAHNKFARKIRKTLIEELTRIDGELDGIIC